MANSVIRVSSLLACLMVAMTTGAIAPMPEYVTELRMRDQLRKQTDPEADLPVPEIVKRKGYPIEVHQVTTKDGYILTMHRIPSGRKANAMKEGAKKPAVFLQHCLLCSSAVWILMGPEDGLAYILADAGFDVWMGNARGNEYSRAHLSLNPDKTPFWDFSWHDIGYYDIPAEIDYVLEKTGEEKLFYVGHSMGTTVFFAMASMRPEYNNKIKAMHALAPVAYVGKVRSPVRLIAPFLGHSEWLFKMLGQAEFLPSSALLSFLGKVACNDEAPSQDLCSNVLFLLAGYDTDQLNTTALPVVLGHLPAGTSTKTVIHYAQGVNSGDFRLYDYGLFKNLKVYGKAKPPKYNLDAITAPVALHYSTNDWLAHVEDVHDLYRHLRNKIGLFKVPHDRFAHLDFLFAIDVKKLLYDNLLDLLQKES